MINIEFFFLFMGIEVKRDRREEKERYEWVISDIVMEIERIIVSCI